MPGDRAGHHGRIPGVQGKRVVRHVLSDANHWKSFVQARLAVKLGDRGCLSLFSGADHRLFGEHLSAEYRVRTEGRGQTVDEWRPRPGGGTTTGSTASWGRRRERSSARLPKHVPEPAQEGPKRKLTEIHREKSVAMDQRPQRENC